ncbi:DsbA family oxidoreductase [Nocardiopsis sp. CT-R113]|uniref:DsbA family oxidoreductase n=1 Tax=Nocardiopsis codii TaxID=3065942 RepID=A0ABU7K3Q6_9ACTN|nr:DsbA family oxidoreductase [Nocardiopsis sp. CT-R113]MEE2036883.1 DsbA family oxidoreductase [Nocardiopsis sp. CT-R113]
MQVEVWSDIVCPWCYIGKRRFEKALEQFEHADRVEVVWRSFQLDPSYPQGRSQPVYDALASKMGTTRDQARAMTDQVKKVAADEGLEYDFANGVMVNTFDVHRLVHLAQSRGLGTRAHEAFMHAQLVQARDLSDIDTLVEVAAEIGLDPEEARRVLEGDDYAEDVREDGATAQRLGGNGVPFFVIDRAFGVSGAQPVEVFVAALEKAHQAAQA